VPSSKPQPDGTLVKALARACRCSEWLDEGVYTSVSEIGDAETIRRAISAGYFGWRCWPLTSLTVILAERKDQAFMLER
jgi:hypothetical protein